MLADLAWGTLVPRVYLSPCGSGYEGRVNDSEPLAEVGEGFNPAHNSHKHSPASSTRYPRFSPYSQTVRESLRPATATVHGDASRRDRCWWCGGRT